LAGVGRQRDGVAAGDDGHRLGAAAREPGGHHVGHLPALEGRGQQVDTAVLVAGMQERGAGQQQQRGHSGPDQPAPSLHAAGQPGEEAVVGDRL